jgi:hypothetical protein
MTAKPAVHQILQACAKQFNIPFKQLTSRSREAPYVEARHVGMYVMQKAGLSKGEIGRIFSRDHTTVSHAVDKVTAELRLPGDPAVTLLDQTERLLKVSRKALNETEPLPHYHGAGFNQLCYIPLYRILVEPMEMAWFVDTSTTYPELVARCFDGYLIDIRAVYAAAESGRIACGGSALMQRIIVAERDPFQYVWVYPKTTSKPIRGATQCRQHSK